MRIFNTQMPFMQFSIMDFVNNEVKHYWDVKYWNMLLMTMNLVIKSKLISSSYIKVFLSELKYNCILSHMKNVNFNFQLIISRSFNDYRISKERTYENLSLSSLKVCTLDYKAQKWNLITRNKVFCFWGNENNISRCKHKTRLIKEIRYIALT